MKALFNALLFLLLTACLSVSAQDKPDSKFGKITAADFELAKDVDTSAGAVLVSDLGVAEFQDGKDGHLTIAYTYYLRYKIIDKRGFDAATQYIQLEKYKDNEEKLVKLQAATYNLENGSIVTTPLEESSVFTDKLSENISNKKFTLPAVKEGSVIEIAYSVRSDFFQYIRPWSFQGRYPVLWSDYTVRIPEFFNYTFISQGFQPFHIRKQEKSYKSYYILFDGASLSINTNVISTRWVMKNVPPIKAENFITSMGNYVASLQFQLAETKPPYEERNYRTEWQALISQLLNYERFGLYLDNANVWLNNDMHQVVKSSDAKLEKAKKIFTYVRDNFSCIDYSAMYMSGSLKDVVRTRKGNVADLNLLLVAMLRHEDINAEPVVLSTRDHGYPYEEYPLLDRFNYVIAVANIDNKEYYLDASERRIGFNKLPVRCYNGYARAITDKPFHPIYFAPDSLKEVRMTAVFISNNVASCSVTPGYYGSIDIRNVMADKGKEQLLKDIRDQLPQESNISGLEIEELSDLEGPVTLRYNSTLDNFNGNRVYFNPILNGIKDNYFKSTKRLYPVEMPYTGDDIYTLNMEIPAGYEVEELPKSIRVNLNESDGMFEYLVSADNNRIMLKSRIRITKTFFQPSDYESLRNFFDQVVKKHAEVIVFKKKN